MWLVAVVLAFAGGVYATAQAQPVAATAAEFGSLLKPVAVIAPQARGFTLPSPAEIQPTGSVALRTGLIAGVDVTPNAVVGIGLFKMRTRQIPGDDTEPRIKSRKAAIGVKLRF